MADDDAYAGLLGAFRYSVGAARSRLFRSFVVVGGLVALFVTLLFVSGLVTVIARTASTPGGAVTLVRAFYVVVLLFTVAPMLGPVLLVARRLRRGGEAACPPRHQFVFGAAGYVYLLALYVGLVITAPDANEAEAAGGVVAWLNGLPDAWGLVPPVAAALAMVALARVVR